MSTSAFTVRLSSGTSKSLLGPYHSEKDGTLLNLAHNYMGLQPSGEFVRNKTYSRKPQQKQIPL